MSDAVPGPRASDLRSPWWYLVWLVRKQRARVAMGALLGTSWMVGLTLPPYVLSQIVNHGLKPGSNYGTLVAWVAVLLGVGAVNAFLAIMRHRTMTKIRLDGAYRTVRAVVEHATTLGATLPRMVTSGEIATIGIGDVSAMAQALTVTGPGFGAVVAYAVVAVLLFSIAPLLAIVVLTGVPVMALIVGPLLGRLQKVGTAYRRQQGGLSARIVDIIGGLRVLNGLGGKDVYAERFRRGSQELRAEGYRVGSVVSWIQALGVGLPAVFLAVVVWLAARMAVQGHINVGELVAVYGYVAVLVVPVSSFIEGGSDVSRALVSARRTVNFLRLSRQLSDESGTAEAPRSPAVLHDPESGVQAQPGQLTAIVSARAAQSAEVVERLGRFVDSTTTWGTTRIDSIAIAQIRDRILVADNDAYLFTGTLSDVIAGRSDRTDQDLAEALYAAVAQDIVEAVPDGLDSHLDDRGSNLSGGQRQRIRLVRALLADPEVLMATEPTSAVDAHTEAAMAGRLYAARAGRTTVVTTTSPLVLDRADVVFYLVDGHTVGSGTHRALLDLEPGYRELVERGNDDDVAQVIQEALQ